jgi:L-ascorbate metabolism protein UlaG (beta-lactamase superfamily)
MNRFVNLDGSGHTKLPKMIRGIRKTIKAKIKHKGAPAPSVKPKIEELLKPVETGAGVRITWLGHSGWLIQTAGKSLLIDPVLGKRINAFLRRKAMFNLHLHKLKPIETVLITHDHYDHLHVRFLRHIGSKVIAGTGTGKFLQSKNIDAIELKWWEFINIGDIKITFVPAKHDSRRGVLDSNMRLWGGFIIETPDICMYHAGDTAYFNIFKEIAKSFKKIDIAFLPIGGYSPENLVQSKNHLTPEQAVKAFKDLGAQIMLPMHWGTYQMSDEPLDEPPNRLIKEWQKNKFEDERLKIMAVGESVHIK